MLARDLHDFLEVGTEFRHWFPRMCEYGFTEGQDFCSFLSVRSERSDLKSEPYRFNPVKNEQVRFERK